MTHIHEEVVNIIREQELDLEDIFASIYTLAHELRWQIPEQGRTADVIADLQYLVAYAIEGRKIVAGKE